MRLLLTKGLLEIRSRSTFGRVGVRRQRDAVSSLLVTVLLSQMVLTGTFVSPSHAHAVTLEQAEEAAGRLSAGEFHSVAVNADGTVSAWGGGQANQLDVPSELKDVVAVSAGGFHSIALKSDGTVTGWGGGDFGPDHYVPSGVENVVAISAGGYHSLALRSDGTVVAAGSNDWSQSNVPAGTNDVIAIAAGGLHSLALKDGGTVVAWGRNDENQCTVPPEATSGVVAIAAGGLHSLALIDGTVVAWGRNDENQCTVPPEATSGVVAIAAGLRHSLALKSDGTVVAWGGTTAAGRDPSVQVPDGLAGVQAIDGGGYHSVALRSDGTFVGWGRNTEGQCLGVVSVMPADGSRGVPVDSAFSVSFSTDVIAGSGYAGIVLRDAGGHATPITKALSGRTLTVTPTSALGNDTTYTLTIPAVALQDSFGNSIPAYSFEYFTPDTRPPVVVSVDYPDPTAGYPASGTLRIHFDEGLFAGPNFGGVVLADNAGTPVDATATIGGYRQRALTVLKSTAFDLKQSYTLTIPAGAVMDESGNTSSQAIKIDIIGDTTPPAKPVVTLERDAWGKVTVKWDAVTDAGSGVASYQVYRDGSPFGSPIAHGPSSYARTYADLAPARSYAFRVRATDKAGNFTDSDAKSIAPHIALAGETRYHTAIDTAKLAFPSGAKAVILATGINFPDALAASPLAGILDAPILLVPTKMPTAGSNSAKGFDATLAYVKNTLKPAEIIVLGGDIAITPAVYSKITSTLGGVKFTRYAGDTRYDTANLIIARALSEMQKASKPFTGTAFLATGANFPDALAAAPISASNGWPVFLTKGTSFTPATKTAMQKAGVKKVVVLGGDLAIDAKTYSQVAATFGSSNVTRIAGDTRYDTAAKIATLAVAGTITETSRIGVSVPVKHTWDRVGITTGLNFPDALAGGMLQAKPFGTRGRSVTLLTNPTKLSAATEATLKLRKGPIDVVTFYGGEIALSQTVRTSVLNALK